MSAVHLLEMSFPRYWLLSELMAIVLAANGLVSVAELMCQLKYFEKIALRVPDRARQDAPDSFVGALGPP